MGLLDKFRSSKTKGPVSPRPSQVPRPLVELLLALRTGQPTVST
jgi:hypothetical protein